MKLFLESYAMATPDAAAMLHPFDATIEKIADNDPSIIQLYCNKDDLYRSGDAVGDLRRFQRLLQALTKNTNLTKLCMNHVPIGDNGARLLAAFLEKNQTITKK
jgi:hypothetical protein